jgi:hypothetical protein
MEREPLWLRKKTVRTTRFERRTRRVLFQGEFGRRRPRAALHDALFLACRGGIGSIAGMRDL